MTFRNWRYTEDRLLEIIEKSPAAIAEFNRELRKFPQLYALKEPIEAAAENIQGLARDLFAAHEYLTNCDAEIDRLRVRARELGDMIIKRSIPGGTYPAPGDRGPVPQRTGTGDYQPIPPSSISNAEAPA